MFGQFGNSFKVENVLGTLFKSYDCRNENNSQKGLEYRGEVQVQGRYLRRIVLDDKYKTVEFRTNEIIGKQLKKLPKHTEIRFCGYEKWKEIYKANTFTYQPYFIIESFEVMPTPIEY